VRSAYGNRNKDRIREREREKERDRLTGSDGRREKS